MGDVRVRVPSTRRGEQRPAQMHACKCSLAAKRMCHLLGLDHFAQPDTCILACTHMHMYARMRMDAHAHVFLGIDDVMQPIERMLHLRAQRYGRVDLIVAGCCLQFPHLAQVKAISSRSQVDLKPISS